MDDSSATSLSSSYQEDYWQLKNQYDEVLESNSQMVLRLEEAKSTLFKNTRELQTQNSVLMSENMNLRAQKEYLQQEWRRIRVLVGNLEEEMEYQRASWKRQDCYMTELVRLVNSAGENNLAISDTATNCENKNELSLIPTALHELEKRLRSSNIGSYYLPTIQEESSGHDNNHDDSSQHGCEADCNVTFKICQSSRKSQGQSTVEGTVNQISNQQRPINGSNPNGRVTSKIGKRGASVKSKKDIREKASPQKANGIHDIKPMEGACPEWQADKPPEMSMHTVEEDQATAIVNNNNQYLIPKMEASPSSNQITFQEHEERSNDFRENLMSNQKGKENLVNKRSLTKPENSPVQANEAETSELVHTNKSMRKAISVKNANRIQEHKSSENNEVKSTFTESKRIDVIPNKDVLERIEKCICRVDLGGKVGLEENKRKAVTTNSKHQPTEMMQNLNKLGKTRGSFRCIAKDDVMQINSDTQYNEGLKDNASTRETQSNNVMIRASETVQSGEPEGPQNESKEGKNNSLHTESEPRRTWNMQNNESNADRTGRVAPLTKKFESKEVKTKSLKPSIATKHIEDDMIASNKNTREEESDGSMKLQMSIDENNVMETSSSTNASIVQMEQFLHSEVEDCRSRPSAAMPMGKDGALDDAEELKKRQSCTADRGSKHRTNSATRTITVENYGQQTDLSKPEIETNRPLARKSKCTIAKPCSLRRTTRTSLFSPIHDHSNLNANVSLTVPILAGKTEGEARDVSPTSGPSSTCLAMSKKDVRASSRQVLRQSQVENSLIGETRMSGASSQGEGCISESSTPKSKRWKRELMNLLVESASFQGDLGSGMMERIGVLTRARSKPRRNKENYNVPCASETAESYGDFEFKPPEHERGRPRRVRK